ncbi:uncharacterized protein METZ01_LOCUS398856, partial [marine metagenome]
MQILVGSTIIMNGCPQITGRRTTHETPMEAITFEKFHSLFQENAYPYRSTYPGIAFAERRNAIGVAPAEVRVNYLRDRLWLRTIKWAR